MKAMSNFLRTGSLRGTRMLASDGAKPRQAEHLALQRLDSEYHPEQERCENDGYVNDNHQERSENRNHEDRHAEKAQSKTHNGADKPYQEALHRVEADEPVSAIRIKQKENNRRHKRKVS
jgi:hypothetical protein